MRWYGVVILGLCVLTCGAAPAAAQPARDHMRAGRVQPLDEILEGIRHSRPGTFYDAEGPFEGPDGRLHYRLKWMTPQGRIIWLDTDARTGRVLGVEAGQRRPVWDRGDSHYRRRNDRGGQDYRQRNYERRYYRGRQYRHRNNDRHGRGYRRDQRQYRQDRGDRSRWGHYSRPRGGRGDDGRSNRGRRGYRDRGHSDYNGGGRGRRPHGW